MTLDPIPLRVLGALIEKEIVTPETYPLSLNALLAACNQRSSRDPVMDVSEEEVRQALHALEDIGLIAVVRDSRVAKYEHRARTVLNLRRDETAILCLLLLRGPQTPGELRARADRMYGFDGLDAVEGTLARLAASSSQPGTDAGGLQALRPLVTVLPRQPGSREARYAHLLGGPIESAARNSAAETSRTREHSSVEQGSERMADVAVATRVAELETGVAALRTMVDAMATRLDELEAAARSRATN